MKYPTSVRLSPMAKALLKALSERLGVSQSAVLEIAIREKARAEGVDAVPAQAPREVEPPDSQGSSTTHR